MSLKRSRGSSEDKADRPGPSQTRRSVGSGDREMRSTRMGSGRRLKTSLPPRRLFVLAFLAGVLALAAVYWSWIDAQARAVVVLSSVLETPVLTPVVEALTSEPRVEDTILAGSPTLIARPGGE